MKIGLIDVDGHNYPNLALMKISAFHKMIGNDVEWFESINGYYDIVYMSKIFSFTPDYEQVIDAGKIWYGGSGYCIKVIDGKEAWVEPEHYAYTKYGYSPKLAEHIEHIYPDYSLYPDYTKDTAYGLLTRGCPRGCKFCHVESKEGRSSYKVADLSEFWDGQKKIVLSDPNILACKEWKSLLQQLVDSKSEIDFNQGLDIRMMTEAKINMLKQIKIKEFHFAWDRYEDKEKILPMLEMFSEMYGLKKNSHNNMVFVLCGYDTTIEQDLERVYTLRELGYYAYIMLYNKESIPRGHPLRKMQRWANNRFIFASCPRFENYQKEAENEDQIKL